MRLQHATAMSSHFARRNAAGRPITLGPLHDRRHRNTEPLGNAAAALARQNGTYNTLTQIVRKGSCHQCWPPSSQHLESQNRSSRNPLPIQSFNETL
jgi:hypothetical protein